MDVRLFLPGIEDLGSIGHPSILVAVLDGPVDMNHPCFAGAALRRLPTLVSDTDGGRMTAHGTAVASILFGQPGSPLVGVVPRCTGLILPVFRERPSGRARLSQLDLVRAVEQALDAGAHVINISGGELSPTGDPEPPLQRALRRCVDENVLVVAAAGNDGCACLHVPAAFPSVLAVGALGRDGSPLESSNWGESYRVNGVLAPGEALPAASPGGGLAEVSGSSFATPLVSGTAALLLSRQAAAGEPIDPGAVAEAILRTTDRCLPPERDECHGYLAGVINVTQACTYLEGGRAIVAELPVDQSSTESVHESEPVRMSSPTGPPDGGVRAAEEPAPQPAAPGTVAAQSPLPPAPAGVPAPAAAYAVPVGYGLPMGYGAPVAYGPPTGYGLPPGYASSPAFGPPAPDSGVPARGVWSGSSPAPVRTSPGSGLVPSCAKGLAQGQCTRGLTPSGDCGCQSSDVGLVYALGAVGFDFGTEARRDSFRQLMPDVTRPGGPDGADIIVSPNPYDVFQLYSYLESRPSESTKLIWTLNLDLTPIYAIEAESGYPEDVYDPLRTALQRQALPKDNDDYVSRVSIPGVRTGRTVQLFSGQIVEVVRAQPRGLYLWNEAQLVQRVIDVVRQSNPDMNVDFVTKTVRAFLDKIYFEVRNLGQSPPDRALNFAATNAYQAAQGVAEGLLSGNTVPGVGTEVLYTLDKIEVSKSPFCRVDSDCWDVKVRFFHPLNDRQAKSVYQFTIDVRDVMPVSLAPAHQYLTT